MANVRLVTSFALVLGFTYGDAHAEKSAPVAEISLDATVQQRGTEGHLGKVRKRRVKRPQRAVAVREQKETAVQRQARVPSSKAVVLPLNPYQAAFEDLKGKVSTIDPTVSGRAEVSFLIGKRGEPKQAAVFGIRSDIDAALTAHLSTLRFPRAHAGQYYTAKLTVRGVAKPVAKKKARKRKRK